MTYKEIKINDHICKFCKKNFNKGAELGGHITKCKLNPRKIELTFLDWTGKKHSEETKQKISKARIKYLTENPDKVPYLINHSSKISYPEQIFKNALEALNIKGWKFQYQNGIYQYDFAFPDLKIDVEIDGGTHKSDKVKKIDKRRDEWSKLQGWKVLRFEAKEVKSNVINCIKKLQELSNPIGGTKTKK